MRFYGFSWTQPDHRGQKVKFTILSALKFIQNFTKQISHFLTNYLLELQNFNPSFSKTGERELLAGQILIDDIKNFIKNLKKNELQFQADRIFKICLKEHLEYLFDCPDDLENRYQGTISGVSEYFTNQSRKCSKTNKKAGLKVHLHFIKVSYDKLDFSKKRECYVIIFDYPEDLTVKMIRILESSASERKFILGNSDNFSKGGSKLSMVKFINFGETHKASRKASILNIYFEESAAFGNKNI